MATQVIAYVPGTGRAKSDLTSWAGDAVFPVTPVATDQIEHPTELTVGADGAITGTAGTYTIRLVDASTGTVYGLSYEIAENITGVASHSANNSLHASTVIRSVAGQGSSQASNSTHSSTGSFETPISTTFTYSPNSGRLFVTLTSWAGNILFPITPVTGDQIDYPNTISVSSAGEVSGTNGVYQVYLISAATGLVYGVDHVVSDTKTGESSHQASTATSNGTVLRVITGSATHSANNSDQTSVGQRNISSGGSHQATQATHSSSGTVLSENETQANTSFTLLPPENHAVVTLVEGFDTYLFQDWTQGTPAAGWQIVYPTFSNTTINNLGELQTDAVTVLDAWAVDLTGTWYGFTIDAQSVNVLLTGSASNSAQNAYQTASGGISGQISGSASHQVNTALHGAIGLRVITGSANTSADNAEQTATGSVISEITGSANHAANDANIVGIISRTINGLSDHQAVIATQRNTVGEAITGDLTKTRVVNISKRYRIAI